MRAVNEWTKENDATFFQAIVFPDMAFLAKELPELLGSAKERKIAGIKISPPHLPTWFSLYRSHNRVTFTFCNFISTFSDYGKELVTAGSAFEETARQLKRSPEKTISFAKEEMQNSYEFLKNLHSLSQVNMKEAMSGTPADEEVRAKGRQYWKKFETELSFFFLVHFPCYIYYKTNPTKLYRLARTGNIGALQNLLKLDPLMLHDPSIGRALQKLRFDYGEGLYKNTVKAALSPLPKMPKKRAKFYMAGLMSMFSDSTKRPMEEPKLRSLYDAITQDATGDKYAIDTDLPDSPEALAKEISRYKSKLHPLMNPDKTF